MMLTPPLVAEIDRLRTVNAELIAALQHCIARIDAIPAEDPALRNLPRAYLKLQQVAQQARNALAKAKL